MKAALLLNILLTNKPYPRKPCEDLVKYSRYMDELLCNKILEKSDKCTITAIMLFLFLRSETFDYGLLNIQDEVCSDGFSDLIQELIPVGFEYSPVRKTDKLQIINELVKIKDKGYEWTYFCVNHDHLMINNFSCIDDFISEVDALPKDVKTNLSLMLSHHLEWINILNFKSPFYDLQNCLDLSFKLVTNSFVIVKTNTVVLDSIQLFNTDFLISILKKSNIENFKRLEDLTDILYALKTDHYIAIPKCEFLRHHDVYPHLDLRINSNYSVNSVIEQVKLIDIDQTDSNNGLHKISELAENYISAANKSHSKYLRYSDVKSIWPDIQLIFLLKGNFLKYLRYLRRKIYG